MFKLFLIVLTLIQFSYADTIVSPMVSLNYNVPDTGELENVESDDSGGGWGIGMRALMGINDQLHFRSGAMLTQKNFSYKINGGGKNGKADFQYSYLVIPLTIYWVASPQVGFFFGTAINAKMDDSCDGSGDLNKCSANKARTLVLPAIVGFDFALSKKVRLEISYEHGLTETAKDIKVNSTVVSLLYNFDSF